MCRLSKSEETTAFKITVELVEMDLATENLTGLVGKSRILMVGAGGIGCELLKNLVLSGFNDIVVVSFLPTPIRTQPTLCLCSKITATASILLALNFNIFNVKGQLSILIYLLRQIDLDTIDVSNLNRQFLFQKEHVGKPKAVVAKESALNFNSKVKIEARHDSIMRCSHSCCPFSNLCRYCNLSFLHSSEYNTSFFKQFTMVLNALDNRAARSHVNRMCLAADVPLIESGTAGYLGQVTVIKKGFSECYDCNPKSGQKSFPGCTIRNTPSEPIHCIVWAKHLFNQLFGEADPDEDVSPDTADPEAGGEAGMAALQGEAEACGNIKRVPTRVWASQSNYEPSKLFEKFFSDDIKYLLSMDKLWTKRRPPTPLVWDSLPETGDSSKAFWSLI